MEKEKQTSYKIYNGDCLKVLDRIEENSIDSIITDPPYGLTSITKRFGKDGSAPAQYGKDGSFARLSKGFMGKEWDGSGIEYNIETWKKCYEVLKPGGYLLAFGGSRTFHRIACAIEDAGFEIRDTIMWLYGSGFPKSMDISKQIDKRGGTSTSWFGEYLKNVLKERNMTQSDLAKYFPSKTGGITGCVHNWVEGKNMPTLEQFNKICEILDLPFDKLEEAEREVIGQHNFGASSIFGSDTYNKRENGKTIDITIPSTDLAKQWQGWGTALKPSFEPIIVARKPFKGSLVDNIIENGVGGINIDECRVETSDKVKMNIRDTSSSSDGWNRPWMEDKEKDKLRQKIAIEKANNLGRFPANTILTYDQITFDEVCGRFPNTKSGSISKEYKQNVRFNIAKNGKGGNLDNSNCYGDSGSASRYFYCAKASKKDRDEGLDIFNKEKVNDGRQTPIDNAFQRGETLRKNTHPTVKPTNLMQYLVRLVTPKGGIILDPFMGSGSTGKAVMYENKERQADYKFIGIEKEQEYCEIAKARIEFVKY